ncbi:MAG TPA: DUF4388 domain-containing protein [Ktedonobacterales bacterium]|jgi:hypothetical protein
MDTDQEPDLQGWLNRILLIDILQMLSLSGQTGALELSQGWNTRSIFFQEGRLTYISQGARPLSLGELLMKSGQITQQQYDFLAQRARQTGSSFARLVVDSGLITPEDVRACAEQQIEEAIYSLFLWRDCAFRFYCGEPETLDLENALPVDISSERLIMEGTRRVDEWSRLSPIIPSLRMIFHPAVPFEYAAEDQLDRLEARDQRILSLVDGRSDVIALAARAGMTRFDVMRSLAALVNSGLIGASLPSKPQIIELFKLLLETIYKKLTLFGYTPVARQFEQELNTFSQQHGLKVRMYTGAVTLTDLDTLIGATALIDLYKLFMNIQMNYFSKTLPPEVSQGLLQGLYHYASPELQELMRLYDFYSPDGTVAYHGFIE